MLESLIMSGAMDCLDDNRARLFAGIEQAVETAHVKQREREMGQFSLFGDTGGNSLLKSPSLPEVKPWPRMEKLAKEKSVLGFWFSGHPLEGYQDELKAFAFPFKQLFTKNDKASVTIGGVIISVARKTRKKDSKPFIVLTIEGLDGSGEAILMNGAYDTYKDIVAVDYWGRKILAENGCNTFSMASHIDTAAKRYHLGTNDPSQMEIKNIVNSTIETNN